MTTQNPNPGARLEELTDYWRMPSVRAARELARKLGVRRVRGTYPWFAIWRAEGLAPPARNRWTELKHRHLTTTDLGELLGESERSARRRDTTKPDASFPDALPIRKKPKLWRSAQVYAWCAGLPVPVYQSSSKYRPQEKKPPSKPPLKQHATVFDPFVQKRCAATQNGEMTARSNIGKNDKHP